MPGFDKEHAKNTIKKYDVHNDGKLDFNEFERFLLDYQKPKDRSRTVAMGGIKSTAEEIKIDPKKAKELAKQEEKAKKAAEAAEKKRLKEEEKARKAAEKLE